MDTQDPPGNETKVVDYVKKVLEAEGIPVIVSAKEPARANLIARLKGNGSKRPLLIMGHTDTVKVDPAKWKFGPFSAARDGGYIYGRGTIDDKDNMTAGMMTMILLKRLKVPLDRDVIFVAEAGEEAATAWASLIWSSKTGPISRLKSASRKAAAWSGAQGEVRYALIQTAEKLPRGVELVAHGVSGHGSRPLRTNPILHLSRAVEKISMWDPPMRFNDTTRYYFEKLAGVSSPEPRRATTRSSTQPKPPPRANISPSTNPAITRCCTRRFRRTSSRADIRST